MPAINIGDNVLVTVLGDLNGQRTMSQFGYVVSAMTGIQYDNIVFPLLRDQLCAANGLMDKFFACLPSNWSPGVMWIQTIRPFRFRKLVHVINNTGPKSDYVANTSNLAGTITRRGDVANRKNISTLHVPCPTTEEWIDAADFGLEAINAYAALCQKIILTQTTVGNVVSFAASIIAGPNSNDAIPLTFAYPPGNVRVMRRRTKGVGI